MRKTLILLVTVSIAFNLNAQYSAEDNLVNALIEISAGTLEKWEMNKETQMLELEKINGQPRIIQYLGYPANYGMRFLQI